MEYKALMLLRELDLIYGHITDKNKMVQDYSQKLKLSEIFMNHQNF